MSWSRWTIRGKLFFAKSGLIGDHFALSCLTHIRNDRTIDCKPCSAKFDSCTELTFMFFSHMYSFFLDYEFKSLQTYILSLNYIWLRFKILNSLNSVKSWHIWVMMTAIWRWSWSFLQVGVCKAHNGIREGVKKNVFFWDFVPNIGPHQPTAHVWDSTEWKVKVKFILLPTHTCKKRVMLRRRLFWPKKKLRKKRVNRDKM